MLMGLANLVPGISGGTMLLATGVYPEFIGAIAEITTLRLKARSIALLAAIALAAAVAVLLFAGPTKDLVVTHRYVMYSLFIGLTLGGVPIVWRLARPASSSVWIGASAGFAVMVVMALGEPARSGGNVSYLLSFVGGLAGASAMILPGVSGGYLLLLIGLYIPLLAAIDDFKTGLLDSPMNWPLIVDSLHIGVPVGLGVIAGIIGVSNLVKYLLERFEKPTLGVLLGLLFGAVVGLWPFQQSVPPPVGGMIQGVAVTAENRESFDPEDWPTARFGPSGAQVGTSVVFVLLGFGITQAVARVGREKAV